MTNCFGLGRDVLVSTWLVQVVLLCLMPHGILVMTCRQFAGAVIFTLSSDPFDPTKATVTFSTEATIHFHVRFSAKWDSMHDRLH